MVSGLTRAFLKEGSTLPSMLRKGVKDINQSEKDIENAPKEKVDKFIRNGYNEHARQLFNVNTSYNANFDYFNNYYNANAARYTPTLVSNLAEQFYNVEKRDRYIREQHLKSTNIY